MKERPNCTVPGPDGNFKLQPDAIELRLMSSDARTKFALPGDTPGAHWIDTMAFSQDGTHAAFITQDSFAVGEGQSCLGWNYDLSSGQLVRTPEALPSEYCGALVEMAWNGDAVYAFDPWIFDPYFHPDGGEVLRWDGAEPTSVRTRDLPSDFQQALAREAKMIMSPMSNDVIAPTTADGLFHLSSGEGDGRQCSSLTIVSKRRDWNHRIGTCIFPREYLLDRDHDLFALLESDLTLFDLRTHSHRSFRIPAADLSELLAEQRLSDGSTRIAYGVRGDCDPASPDAAHTPAYGETPNSNKPVNVCFVRIPAK